MIKNIFGKNLKELRLENDLSQTSLGKVLNVSNQTISAWENGTREPDLDNLVNIARYFEISLDFLLGEKD